MTEEAHGPAIDLDTEQPVEMVPSLSYEAQKRLFDRYHRGTEYVIDGVIHRN